MDKHMQSVHDDLAFMRGIVETGSRRQMTGGIVFVAGGLLYGLQTLFHWAQYLGWLNPPPLITLIFVIGISVVFLTILAVVLWKSRHSGVGGVTHRALNAAFSAAGLANTAMICVFGIVAARNQSLLIWLLYPAVVFALQGAAWHIAFMLQRRAWMCAVSIGWLAASVGLGLTLGTSTYILIAAISLFFLMALPGAVMVRAARRESSS